MTRKDIFLILLMVGLFSFAWQSFYIVDAGEHAVVFNRAGGSLRESDQGIHAKWPLFIDQVTKYEMRGQLYETQAESASRDLQVVKATVAVLYHPDPGQVSTIHLSLGPDYAGRVIAPAVSEVVKATTAQFNAVQLIELRPIVKAQIAGGLTAALEARHVIVDTVSITDFEFSPEFDAAIEKKVEAQQRAEQANNTLAQVRYEAQQRVIQAQADLESANYSAQAAVALAQGNATAVQFLREQFGTVDAYLQWERLRIWDGVMPQTLVFNGGNATGANVLVGLP